MHQVSAETINKPAAPTPERELDWMLPFGSGWSQSPCCLSFRLQGQSSSVPVADEDPPQQQRLRAVGLRGSFLRSLQAQPVPCSLFPVCSLFPGLGQQSCAVHGQLAEKANCREQFSLSIQPIFAKAWRGASKQKGSAQTQQSQADRDLGYAQRLMSRAVLRCWASGFPIAPLFNRTALLSCSSWRSAAQIKDEAGARGGLGFVFLPSNYRANRTMWRANQRALF